MKARHELFIQSVDNQKSMITAMTGSFWKLFFEDKIFFLEVILKIIWGKSFSPYSYGNSIYFSSSSKEKHKWGSTKLLCWKCDCHYSVQMKKRSVAFNLSICSASLHGHTTNKLSVLHKWKNLFQSSWAQMYSFLLVPFHFVDHHSFYCPETSSNEKINGDYFGKQTFRSGSHPALFTALEKSLDTLGS